MEFFNDMNISVTTIASICTILGFILGFGSCKVYNKFVTRNGDNNKGGNSQVATGNGNQQSQNNLIS